MKCLLLAGGHGTRMRPLSLSIPKPFIPFCNIPIIEYQIEASVKAGVDHIIIAISSGQSNMTPMIKTIGERCNVRIDCSIETESLGTAGPLRLARELIFDPNDDSEEILVLNSDIICTYPFSEMIAAHRKNKADSTILVTTTTHPSDFGVIVHDKDYRIKAFVEKPKEFISNLINAGVYVINKAMIDKIPEGNVSIERSFFPMLVSMEKTFCHPLYGMWADVGKPSDFIRGHQLYMLGNTSRNGEFIVYGDNNGVEGTCDHDIVAFKTKGGLLIKSDSYITDEEKEAKNDYIVDLKHYQNIADDIVIRPPILIHESAEIGSGCDIGPNVTIGPNTIIGPGCRIIRSVILDGSRVDAHNYVEGSIIGWNSHLKRWGRVEGLTVLGKGVTVGEGLFIRECVVLPHKEISKSIYDSGTIIM